MTGSLHPAVGLLINSMVLLPLVTYVAMRFMTRRLRRWLFPPASVGGRVVPELTRHIDQEATMPITIG